MKKSPKYRKKSFCCQEQILNHQIHKKIFPCLFKTDTSRKNHQVLKIDTTSKASRNTNKNYKEYLINIHLYNSKVQGHDVSIFFQEKIPQDMV